MPTKTTITKKTTTTTTTTTTSASSNCGANYGRMSAIEDLRRGDYCIQLREWGSYSDDAIESIESIESIDELISAKDHISLNDLKFLI